MKKLLTIMLILFVGFAAFAQDSVVVYYADDSIPSQDYNMFYAGLEFGAGSINNLTIDNGIGNQLSISPMTGFEMSPVLGIRPFDNTNFAFELNVMMDLLDYKSYDAGINDSDIRYVTQIISPQILAIYTFGGGMVRPFAGLGMGANFNNFAIEADEISSDGTVETKTNNYDVNTSFSMVLKSGAKISIPNSNFDIYALCRYNLNIPTEIKFDDNTTKSKMNASTLSAALGVVYNF